MARKAPGKSYREGMTIVELMDMFPTEEAATEWFESVVWEGRSPLSEMRLGRNQGSSEREANALLVQKGAGPISVSAQPRRWRGPMSRSTSGLSPSTSALTSLKSVSSMKLKRDIGVSQPTAWSMLHRIREAWGADDDEPFDGPVEVDETYVGGKWRNMS